MNKLKQFFCSHRWTCAISEGIKATPEQLAGGVDGFMDYATTYCGKCGMILKRRK